MGIIATAFKFLSIPHSLPFYLITILCRFFACQKLSSVSIDCALRRNLIQSVGSVLPPCIALLCIAASMTRIGENQSEAVRRAHTTRPISMNAFHNGRPTPLSFNLRHQAWAREIVAVLPHAHRAPAPARAAAAQAVKIPRRLKNAYVHTLHPIGDFIR